tara:strand:- start:3311 stop:4186 length:876 start_codon:yes stop_codon:yes gene_type:complete
MEQILNTYTTLELKKEISKTNLKRYSKMKKKEVINLMLKHPQKFNHLEAKKKEPKKKVVKKKELTEEQQINKLVEEQIKLYDELRPKILSANQLVKKFNNSDEANEYLNNIKIEYNKSNNDRKKINDYLKKNRKLLNTGLFNEYRKKNNNFHQGMSKSQNGSQGLKPLFEKKIINTKDKNQSLDKLFLKVLDIPYGSSDKQIEKLEIDLLNLIEGKKNISPVEELQIERINYYLSLPDKPKKYLDFQFFDSPEYDSIIKNLDKTRQNRIKKFLRLYKKDQFGDNLKPEEIL